MPHDDFKDEDEEFDPRAIRRKLDMNQHDFWAAVGVTQSGGSRYEQDRRIPKPVMELLRLRYKYNIKPELITIDNASMVRAVTEGQLDPGTLHAQLEKIQDVIKATHTLAESAAAMSAAAEAILEVRIEEQRSTETVLDVRIEEEQIR